MKINKGLHLAIETKVTPKDFKCCALLFTLCYILTCSINLTSVVMSRATFNGNNDSSNTLFIAAIRI